jgi:hypothetical protein
MFSNLSICFQFGLPQRNLVVFATAFKSLPLRLSGESEKQLAAWSQPEVISANQAQAEMSAVSLQITFLHNEPYLRLPAPRFRDNVGEHLGSFLNS